LLIENYRLSGLVVALVVFGVFVVVTVCNVTERPGDQTQEHENSEGNQTENDRRERVD
jgi:hypothetical protein